MLILGRVGKEGREGKRKEKVKIKKIALPDDSFAVTQIFPYSRATCHSRGPSFVTECCHSGAERHPTYPGLASETHRKSPLLVAECCHLTRVAMCVRVNSTRAPSSYDFNLFEVPSC